MSTPDERVEVTPEMLAAIERTEAEAARYSDSRALVLALVQRIRELESEVEDWKGAYQSAVRRTWAPPDI